MKMGSWDIPCETRGWASDREEHAEAIVGPRRAAKVFITYGWIGKIGSTDLDLSMAASPGMESQ